MRIYLAGKIAKNDWRHEVSPWLRSVELVEELPMEGGHVYVGPFFIGCDHGCGHGPGTHGLGGEHSTCAEYPSRSNVKKRALAGIASADLVFAWLDDVTAFGTIYEIGHAHALGKRVIVGVPESGISPELWFTHTGHRVLVGLTPAETCRRAIADAAPLVGGTFIEQAFSVAFRQVAPDTELSFQHPVLNYRLDFAHVPSMTAIELDGLKGHATPTDIEKDRRRQRAIEGEGWSVIRFGGREVTTDPRRCALEAYDRIVQATA